MKSKFVILTLLVLWLLSIFITIKLCLRVKNEELIMSYLEAAADAHLLSEGRHDELIKIKKDKLSNITSEKVDVFENASENQRRTLIIMIKQVYEKNDERLPKNLEKWIESQ